MPDVIFVYMGTIDWCCHVPTEGFTQSLFDEPIPIFQYGYEAMLQKIRTNYPDSEVWCCTLGRGDLSKGVSFQYPYLYTGPYAGRKLEEYNSEIRNAARENQCGLIDLYNCATPYETIDGVHPTEKGMLTIAETVVQEMLCKDRNDSPGGAQRKTGRYWFGKASDSGNPDDMRYRTIEPYRWRKEK